MSESNIGLKYYAFDWDGNLLYMPTKIIAIRVSDNTEAEISPLEWRNIRGDLLKNGYKIVDEDQTFKNFRKISDVRFFNDSKRAEFGPAWVDFIECINNASIFAIITARGHRRSTFKRIIKWFIENNIGGISIEQFVEHQKAFMDITKEPYEDFSNSDFIDYYLNMCRFYGMNDDESLLELFGSAKMMNIDQEFKKVAIKKFEEYILHMGYLYEKNVKNNIEIRMGFSDDDIITYNTIREMFNMLDKDKIYRRAYYTGNGKKE